MRFILILIQGIYTSLVVFRCVNSKIHRKGNKNEKFFEREFIKILVGCRDDESPGTSCIRDVETMQIKFNKSELKNRIDFTNHDTNNDPFSGNFEGPSFLNMLFILESIHKMIDNATDLKTLLTQYYAFYTIRPGIGGKMEHKHTPTKGNLTMDYTLAIPIAGTKPINAKLSIKVSENGLFTYEISGNSLLCWKTIDEKYGKASYEVNDLFDKMFIPNIVSKFQIREGFAISEKDFKSVIEFARSFDGGRKGIFNDYLLLRSDDGLIKILVNKKNKEIELYDKNKVLDLKLLPNLPIYLEIANLDWYL